MDSVKKFETRALVVLFIVAIWLPLLATFWNSAGGSVNNEEKRKLAEFPEFHLTREGINKFPVDFTKYFDDNFGMRDKLIKLHSYIKAFFFGITPTSRAILGKQGWLFLGDGNIIADYRHAHPFTEAELEHWRDTLVAKRDWLAARGIKYLFMVAPDKQTIYPEYMPDRFNRIRPDSCLDQLVAYLKQHSDIEILDVRPALLAEKAVVRDYHKTDTHWNERGAFVVYQQIMQRLAKDFLDIPVKTLADFNPVEETVEGQDLAIMMGLRNVMHEQVLRLEPKTEPCARPVDYKLSPDFSWPAYPPGHEAYARQCDKAKLKAVFFQDSFGTSLAPFVSEAFKSTVFIWDYPNYEVMNAAVQQVHPDVVIEERVERHVKSMPQDFDMPSDLVGIWFSGNNKVEIKHLSSGSVYLINEHGSQVIGVIKAAKLTAHDWNLTGDLLSGRNKIVWSNGTKWVR